MTYEPAMMTKIRKGKVIAAFQMKGGAGKTNTTANLSCISARKLPTAAMDADPNSSLTLRVRGAEETALKPVLYCHYDEETVFKNDEEEVSLFKAELEKRLSLVDRIWIDTAPNMHGVSVEALRYADLILIPAFSSPDDIEKARVAIDGILDSRADFPGHIAVLPFRLKKGTGLAKHFAGSFEDYGDKITVLPPAYDFDTNILASIAGQGVVEYAKNSSCAANWRFIYEQIAQILTKQERLIHA